jgi:hypothetical protein
MWRRGVVGVARGIGEGTGMQIEGGIERQREGETEMLIEGETEAVTAEETWIEAFLRENEAGSLMEAETVEEMGIGTECLTEGETETPTEAEMQTEVGAEIQTRVQAEIQTGVQAEIEGRTLREQNERCPGRRGCVRESGIQIAE